MAQLAEQLICNQQVIGSSPIIGFFSYGPLAQLVRAPPCHGGGHGFESRLGRSYGILAQLGEHLPYKQRVIGSSPIGSIDADVAQLAEQLICNQQVIGSSPIIGFSRYKNYIEIWADSRVAKGDRL